MKSDEADEPMTAGRLTILYIVALSTVALLSIAGQSVVQLAIASQTSDARLINVAGRQRMLSQRVSKAALELDRETDAMKIEALRTELEFTLDEWKRAQDGLLNGNEELGLEGTKSSVALREFETLAPIQQSMSASTRKLLDSESASDRANAINALLTSEDTFLESMDGIVYTLEQEASSRVQLLRRIELTLLTLTLLVLAIEGLFIFRPAVRSLQRSISRIHEARAREEKAARELKTIFENVPALIWYQDEKGNIIRANDRAAQIVSDIRALDGVRTLLNETLHRKQTHLSLYDTHGAPVYLNIKCKTLPGKDKHEQGFVFLAEDVTDRERLENQLLQIKVDEQRRIGHDLHDGVGQILTGVLYLSSRLHKQLDKRDAPEAAAAFEIVDHVKESIAQVRSLTRGLCPLDEKEGGLASALRELTDRTAKLSGIKCTSDFNEYDIDIGSPTDEQLYRIAQEAVSNAVRHSGAKRIVVGLNQQELRLVLTVRDDGKGLPMTTSSSGHDGMGIRIMRRRAELCGGTLKIDSTSDVGTTVRFQLHHPTVGDKQKSMQIQGELND